jgi:hypothetical protein
MANITVSTDVDNFMGAADTAAMRAAAVVDIRTDANGAVSIGDLGGNARGANAINIQAIRDAGTPSQVASGDAAVAIGNYSTASGNYSTASGYYTTASGYYGATAVGSYATASGYYSTASGNYAEAKGNSSTATGANTYSGGYYSTASGYGVRTTVDNTCEFGYWSDASTRGGAIRSHSTGMVAMTFQDRSTEYDASAAANGSEADNELATGMWAIRTNGNAVVLDINIGGTVKNISLGTAS